MEWTRTAVLEFLQDTNAGFMEPSSRISSPQAMVYTGCTAQETTTNSICHGQGHLLLRLWQRWLFPVWRRYRRNWEQQQTPPCSSRRQFRIWYHWWWKQQSSEGQLYRKIRITGIFLSGNNNTVISNTVEDIIAGSCILLNGDAGHVVRNSTVRRCGTNGVVYNLKNSIVADNKFDATGETLIYAFTL